MLTPSENLILSHFHFSVFFDLTYHNITDAKLVPRKLKSSMIYPWMTSLTSALELQKYLILYSEFLVPVVLYICTEMHHLSESKLATDVNYFVQQPCIYCYLLSVNPGGVSHAFCDGLSCT